MQAARIKKVLMPDFAERQKAIRGDRVFSETEVPVTRPRLAGVTLTCWNERMTPDHEPEVLREQIPPYAPPPETQRLIDELYREELLEARSMRPEQKLLLGEELFAYACSITMAGIQNQFPEADEAERRRILEQRLVLQRKLGA